MEISQEFRNQIKSSLLRIVLLTSVTTVVAIGISKYQNKEKSQQKSKLIQKVRSPPPTPTVFRNDNGTTNTIYAHRDAKGQLYFDNNPSTDSLVEKYEYDWR
ncbi:MAG: hypothetical protein WC584_00245 [Candidatus Pacearchaeota archaeon]